MASRRSVSELSSDPLSVIQEAVETKEPIFISVGSQAQTLLVDADTYLTDMQALAEFKRIFADERSITPDREILLARNAAGGRAARADGCSPAQASDAPGQAQDKPQDKPRYMWRCLLCGHVVETETEELPEGFTCAMCGAGKDMFARI